MFFKKILFFLFVIVLTSCQFFTIDKKQQLQEIDTIVDFSRVDVSPSFPTCDSLINKTQKDHCFRTSLHQIIATRLLKEKFLVHQPIDETIFVNLVIDNTGTFRLKSITSSPIIKKEIPKLDSLLKVSILALPQIHPATKRGIPVATQYQLPIKILLKEWPNK